MWTAPVCAQCCFLHLFLMTLLWATWGACSKMGTHALKEVLCLLPFHDAGSTLQDAAQIYMSLYIHVHNVVYKSFKAPLLIGFAQAAVGC